MSVIIMKKKIFASLAIITPLLFCHGAFANDEQSLVPESLVKDLNQQLTQELSLDDLLEATQDYVLEKVELPQARRSALFAHIFDTMVKNATMAQADTISKTFNS